MIELEILTGGRSRKLWIPYGGLRWPPPRLIQLCCIAACAVTEHAWSDWRVETEDWFELVLEPVEWAWRICTLCGLTQHVRRRSILF